MRPSLESYSHLAGGKVRDLYVIDDEHLLLVASDRISAYDHVLATPRSPPTRAGSSPR